MANCLPAHIETWNGLYDLKGSADDKVLIDDGERVIEAHKRCWKLNWMAGEAFGCNKCIPVTRRRYLSGKKKGSMRQCQLMDQFMDQGALYLISVHKA